LPVTLLPRRPQARVRVCRPAREDAKVGFLDALHRHEHELEAITQEYDTGAIGPESALQRLMHVLRVCSCEGAAAPVAAPTPSGRDQPWFDDDCRGARGQFEVTWSAWHASRGHQFDGVGDPAAHTAMVAARRRYKQVVKRKKWLHQRSHQLRLLTTYFSKHQREFWRELLGRRDVVCPLDDVDAWTDWFVALMGTKPQAPCLAGAETARNARICEQLRAARPPDCEAMKELNDPFTVDEVGKVMAGLPNHKSADVHGLTCELLSVPAQVHTIEIGSDGAGEGASEGASEGQGRPTGNDRVVEDFVCRPLVECVTTLMNGMLFQGAAQPADPQGGLPDPLCVCKLTPVPKQGQHHDAYNRDMYRGICVSPVIARVFDRLLHNRLDTLIENLCLRAATQCGFRKKHGTLDAVFALQHLVNRARFNRERLYVVFVDFRKAFDSVRRDLLLARCQQLGVHGPFLHALTMLYDHIVMRVVVNGQTGTQFNTYMGTKQGSELSPLLFGLFIEVLHDLIRLRVPGAGPVLSGGLKVPDLMYADDVCLVAESPGEAQKLLDCLDLFCCLFDMEVNLAPHKTCVVVFRPPGMQVPRGLTLRYKGQVVQIQPRYTYLGVVFHQTMGWRQAANKLAGSGTRAMHALLSRLRAQHITQYDMKCRLFDALVEPVLSYGSHVWGPEVFCEQLFKPLNDAQSRPEAEKTHLAYLRCMAGVGKSTCIDVLMRDMHRLPIAYHWVVLACRWWERLRQMAMVHSGRVAYQAWVSDIELMVQGCRSCWTYQLLHTMTQLHVVSASEWQGPGCTVHAVKAIALEPKSVAAALASHMQARWAPFAHPGNPRDPTLTHGVVANTHARWVYPIAADQAFTRATAPAFMKLCMPYRVLQCVAQLRWGCAPLEVHVGRMGNGRTDRQNRVCRLCSQDGCQAAWRACVHARTGSLSNVEDLKHFLLECPAYDCIRDDHKALFYPTDHQANPLEDKVLVHIFGYKNQEEMATALYRMWVHRLKLLALPVDDHTLMAVLPCQ
jgi:hypothetical protein